MRERLTIAAVLILGHAIAWAVCSCVVIAASVSKALRGPFLGE